MIQNIAHLRAVLAAPFSPGNDVLITPMIEAEIGARMLKAARKARFRFAEICENRYKPAPQMTPEMEARVDRAVELRMQGKTLDEIADALGVAQATVYRDLIRGGAPVEDMRKNNGRHKSYAPEVIDGIREMAKSRTMAEIAEHHKISRRTLNRICAKHGIESQFKMGVLSAEKNELAKVARRMHARGASVKEICAEIGRSVWTVREYLESGE